jgi:HD superfamily phosphohydrolase
VTAKGLSAVEAYLQSRYHMYRNVYFHKVVRTGEGMLKLALRRARRLAEQDRLSALSRADATFKAMVGGQFTLAQFTDLDDISVMHCLKLWITADDPILASLSHGLLYRNLYKTIDLTSVDDPAKLRSAIDRAAHAVTAAGGDPNYHLFYDEPRDTPYEIYDGQNPASDIPIQTHDGRLASFAALSPLTPALSRQLMFRRLHVAPEYRAAVESAVSKSPNLGAQRDYATRPNLPTKKDLPAPRPIMHVMLSKANPKKPNRKKPRRNARKLTDGVPKKS